MADKKPAADKSKKKPATKDTGCKKPGCDKAKR